MKNNDRFHGRQLVSTGIAVITVFLLLGVSGYAASVPNNFSSGTTISSSEVNENFDYLSGQVERSGRKVGPGLYEVHTRVLWDVGWMRNETALENGYFAYRVAPRNLIYAGDRTLFLSPLRGYGIPEVQAGATRKVRLYVYYGEQLDFNGVPTITVTDYQGQASVAFVLPKIGGHYADEAANWTNYITYSQYQTIGHSYISMSYANCSNCGIDRPYGVVYRVEAHFYDEFPE